MRTGAVRSLAALLAIAVLMVSACTGGGRPAIEDWGPTWEDTRAVIPALASLGYPPDREVCGHTLGVLRSLQPDLFPTPDLAFDEAVKEWVTVAEDAMFECPPSSHKVPDLAYAYEELARLEAEVDAVLSIDLSAD